MKPGERITTRRQKFGGVREEESGVTISLN